MDISAIYEAKERLNGILRETNLIRTNLSRTGTLYLKPENLQVTGSFKIRGAYNKIAGLSAEERARGVIACSSGNHAQGVAFAAQKMGIHAVICMPASAPTVKIDATRSMGAEVVLVDGVYDDAYDKALQLQQEFGYTFVHPYNDEAVIAGQGTIGLEILDELPETDAIVTAIGGGGLISGIALAAKTLKPELHVYGVQAANAPGMYASIVKGYVDRLDHMRPTIADGIAVKAPGNITFDYVSRYVDDIFTVQDEQIAEAIRRLLSNTKIVAEGAGAAPVAAAVLQDWIPELKEGKNVVSVISGGNIDLSRLTGLLSE